MPNRDQHPLPMIPRFSNPHLLPENAKRVSRAEIAIDDEQGHFLSQEVDLEVIEHLNHLLKRALPEPTQQAESKRKKRRKVEINEVADPIPDEPTCAPLHVMNLWVC